MSKTQTERLITDAEKIELKTKIIALMMEIERSKTSLYRRFSGIELVGEPTDEDAPEDQSENTRRAKEADKHREKIYEIEERSHQAVLEENSIARIRMHIEEAALYSLLINNDTHIDVSQEEQ